ARPHRIDRGSAGDPQGARGEDPPPVFRARGPGADDPRGDRLAARDYPGTGATNKGKSPGAPPTRVAGPGAGKLPVIGLGRVHYRPMAGLACFDISPVAAPQEAGKRVNQPTKEWTNPNDFKGRRAPTASAPAK